MIDQLLDRTIDDLLTRRSELGPMEAHRGRIQSIQVFDERERKGDDIERSNSPLSRMSRDPHVVLLGDPTSFSEICHSFGKSRERVAVNGMGGEREHLRERKERRVDQHSDQSLRSDEGESRKISHLRAESEQEDVVVCIPLQDLTKILRVLLRQIVKLLLTRLRFEGSESHRPGGEDAELGWFPSS